MTPLASAFELTPKAAEPTCRNVRRCMVLLYYGCPPDCIQAWELAVKVLVVHLLDLDAIGPGAARSKLSVEIGELIHDFHALGDPREGDEARGVEGFVVRQVAEDPLCAIRDRAWRS